MKKNIIRIALVYVIGLVLGFVLHFSFFKIGNQADIIMVIVIFYFYSILALYSFVMDNLLYYFYKKNYINSFIVSNTIPFIYIIFSYIGFGESENEELYFVFYPSFLILNIIFFFRLKQHKKNII